MSRNEIDQRSSSSDQSYRPASALHDLSVSLPASSSVALHTRTICTQVYQYINGQIKRPSMDSGEFIRAQDDRSSTTIHREQQTIANVLYGRVSEQGDWGCLTRPPVKVCSKSNLPIVHGRVRHLKYCVSTNHKLTCLLDRCFKTKEFGHAYRKVVTARPLT